MKLRGGSDTGGQHGEVEESQRNGRGVHTVGSPAAGRIDWLGAVTAVSIEREVVSGHAYAIRAPEADSRGWCGHDRPTFVSVNGVSDP